MKSKPSLLFTRLFFGCSIISSSLCAAVQDVSKQPTDKTATELSLIPQDNSPGYTINFDNVSIIEYIKFISKISGTNFIYNEDDLSFNVTILSEEPTKIINVMAALIQVLKINGLDLIEQDNTLVITKTGLVRQIATVVSQEVPIVGPMIPPIMTRVFKVKNANPMTLAALVRPMLSADAIVEVSAESRHLIITDIARNIEQIHKLFLSLDIPKSALEINSYSVHNNSPEALIELASQILIPISEGNPLIFVPQNSTNSIHLVSTPFLIERALMILEDLDTPPALTKRFSGPITGQNILLYNVENRPADILQTAVKQIIESLGKADPGGQSLLQTLDSMRYIRESHSLLFVGHPDSLTEIRSILKSLDIPYSNKEKAFGHEQFKVFRINHADQEQITSSLDKFAKHLSKSSLPDTQLLKTIQTMKWIPENHSLMFTGNDPSLKTISQLLPIFDVPYHQGKTPSKLPINNDFYIYTPKYGSGEKLLKEVEDVHGNLKEANLADPAFLHTLKSGKWVSSTHSLVFTGDPQSLDRIHALIEKMDIPKGPAPEKVIPYLYHINFVSTQSMDEGLQKLSKSLPEALAHAIDNKTYIPESNSFLFKGNEETIKHLETLLPTLDNAETAKKEAQNQHTYDLYTLKNPTQGPHIINELHEFANTLNSSKVKNPELIQAIKAVKWKSSNHSLTLTGTPPVIESLKSLISHFDQPADQKTPPPSFHIYHKPADMSVQDFQEHIEETIAAMEKARHPNLQLMQTLKSATFISQGSAIMFTGSSNELQQLDPLIKTFDMHKKQPSQKSDYFIYKPTSVSPEQIKSDIFNAAAHMEKSGLDDTALLKAMKSVQVEKNQQRLIFTGTPQTISKIQGLVKTFDTHEVTAKANQYYIFKPHYQSSSSIIEQAQHTANEMKGSGLTDPHLVQSLNSATTISNGTGVLFTGTPEAINSIKEITEKFDTEHAKHNLEIFPYTPHSTSIEDLKKNIYATIEHLENQKHPPLSLIDTLRGMSVINNKSVFFSGPDATIKKIQELLPTLDFSKDSHKKPEKPILETYKVKYNVQTLEKRLRALSDKLAQHNSNGQYSGVIRTINTMHPVTAESSNKMITFFGPPVDVQEVLGYALQYDTPDESDDSLKRHPDDIKLYTPKHIPGEQLLNMVRDFEHKLLTSGVNNSELSDTINHLTWMATTSSIIVSGDQQNVNKVLALLERFDKPGPGIPKETSGIDTISDTSFLIYKLQYHSGSEIQDAIKKIGMDLEKVKGGTNQDLSDAVNTLQWIEVTNSLIGTGKPDALAKIKELIKSIDVPLKQVFVEILVIETSIGNNLSFGLRWGSQGVYKDKFSYGTYLTRPSTQNDLDPLRQFNQKLSNVNASSTPTGDFIPVASGFDLGVIGDIILHKGKSYLALGSLLNALRVDGDSTIVMNQKVITQDNKLSSIFIGKNVPYVGSVVSNTGNTNVTTANLEYRDVGVSLNITPTVGNNDIITLEIEEDISEQIQAQQGNSTSGTDRVSGITTTRTTTKTVASVPDKSFLVLSGSIQDSTTHSRTSIPCLGGLPLIGAAFTNTETNKNIQNILIFVRPQIIKSFETYHEITDRQEDLFRNQTIAEDFDAALELVKTPDDTF